MKTILYIHGYGSTGNAVKGQLLRTMFPQHRILSPTLDYNRLTPYQVHFQLRQIIDTEHVDMIVGSSFGGYHALCCSTFFTGPIWAVNPVHDVMHTLRRQLDVIATPDNQKLLSRMTSDYESFDQFVFQNASRLFKNQRHLHFALSTDDELLGDHQPLLKLFPKHKEALFFDHCVHRFLRFEELKPQIAKSLT